MKCRFVDERRAKWPLKLMCSALGISRQAYHAWKSRRPSERHLRHERLRLHIRQMHEASNGSYGSPRLTHALRREGEVISRKTVERIMQVAGIRANVKRRFRPTTDSSKTLVPAANLLQRSFDVHRPDKVWVSDFTELPCRNGKAYAVAIMDLCSRRILGMVVSHSMQTRTLLKAFDDACRVRRRLPPEPIIFHSDRGSQYNADLFRTELAKRNFIQSMSNKGNCYDNATMESFWARMKTELGRPLLFDDLRDARSTVYRWTHLFYNRQRIHSSINNMTPVQFEQQLFSQI
ncbi:MAG: IS3 family transposase ['Candidatus Kapabacteria' thiocyanatum]|nr:IS3 family transposase ['Candidatus Kapabacteria' thiocyanatum]